MKNKILHITMGLNIGGAETHIIDVVKALQDKYDVLVASNGGSYVSELEKYNIRHFKIKFNSKNPFVIIHSMHKLKKIINQDKIDLVHSHARIPSFIAGIVCKNLGVRFVTTTHGHFKVNTLLKKLSDWGEYSIAVSRDLKDYLVNEYKFNQDKVFLSLNGINTDIFKKDKSLVKNKIVHVSRLDTGTSKVAKILIKNAKHIYETTGLKIKIVGDGSEFKQLKALADTFGKEQKFLIFTGKTTSVYQELKDAKVFVGVSRSLLEAMCFEIPVILAGDVGYGGIVSQENVASFVDTNFTGRKLNDIDENKFLNDIIRAAESKLDFEWTRQYIINKYSVKQMTLAYFKLYNKILSTNKNYLISGYYGYKNSGDDALLASVVKDIKEINPQNYINILSKKNSYYEFKNVNFTDRFNILQLIKSIKKTDILIMGGGSLLQDKTSNRSLYYYLSVIKIASIFKKRVYLYANGIGPLDKAFNLFLTKKILDKTFAITFRDEDSYQFVTNAGVTNPYMLVTADSVFSLESNYKSEKEAENKVAFVIRDWKNSEQFCKELAKFADHLIDEENLKVVFVPLKLEDDEEISKNIVNLMHNHAKILLMDNEKELIEYFSTCFFTVCMRFHGVIYSSIASSISIGLSYDKKVSSICNELELDYMDTSNIKFEALIEIKNSIINNYEDKKLILNKNVDKLKKKAKKNKELLHKI